MLKLKYLFENFDLAKEALKNWEHNTDKLDAYLKWFRISSNAVYPFERNGKRHFLRLAPVSEKIESNLRGELEFLQYLHEEGYNSMVPVAATNEALLLTLDTQWGTYYASVFEGVSGKCIEDTDYQKDIMFAYGQALGKLHCLSMEYQPVHPKWSYEEALAWITQTFKEYHAPASMLAEAAHVAALLEVLPKTRENFGLVHYDFEPDNVFFDAAFGTCNVIDFEDGMYHFFLIDIEQVFDALSDELADDALREAKDWFLEGYQSEKPLEPDFEEKLPLMRRFCNLFSYARLLRCVSDNIQNEPDWMQKLRAALSKKMTNIEAAVTENEFSQTS